MIYQIPHVVTLDTKTRVFQYKLLNRIIFIIKFPYNSHSDWLKQRALSENRARVDDGKLAFKFLLRNFDKFDQIKHPL